MGSDAEVFIFNYEAYTEEVVPLFRELLLSGQVPEWLYPAVDRRKIQLHIARPTDLLRHCTFLGKDLSWTGSYNEKDVYGLPWDERACQSEVCQERDHCPLHLDQSQDMAEQLLWLFEAAVGTRCLGQGQFVGRSMVVTNYGETLSNMGVKPDDPLMHLLMLLGKRGFVIGYQWGFGYEGINGWLDPRETLALVRWLDELPLPEYELSFEAMRSFNKPHPNAELYEQFGITGYNFPGVPFAILSLSFVRTVATLATAEGKGILWGNGVFSGDYYLQPRQ